MDLVQDEAFDDTCPVVNEYCKDEICIICHQELSSEDAVRKPPECNHLFHSECLREWITRHRAICPLCQVKIIPQKRLLLTHEAFKLPNGYVYGGVTHCTPRRVITGSERIAMTTVPWHKGVTRANLITVRKCEKHDSDIIRLECFKEDGTVHTHERCYLCFPSWKQHYMF